MENLRGKEDQRLARKRALRIAMHFHRDKGTLRASKRACLELKGKMFLLKHGPVKEQ